jgi:hypothetical protein
VRVDAGRHLCDGAGDGVLTLHAFGGQHAHLVLQLVADGIQLVHLMRGGVCQREERDHGTVRFGTGGGDAACTVQPSPPPTYLLAAGGVAGGAECKLPLERHHLLRALLHLAPRCAAPAQRVTTTRYDADSPLRHR